ncbi:MAG TPA: hypothetical protein VHR66_31700 [Gemmataceae bacterium]|nr:hypothetical protein [Gemmataceae bacterium]
MKYQLTLRDGTAADGMAVLTAMSYLRFVLNESNGRDLVEGLNRMCRGETEEVPADVRSYFNTRGGLIMDLVTKAPRPLIGRLLANALRAVPDGITLVEPYENTIANRATAEALNEVRTRNFRDFLGQLGIDPDNRGGGRS